MNYIKSLDGLRALAVILVILFHYYYGRFWGFGWIGVQLFLVLSGFLITSILLNAKTKSWNLYFGEFYWRRALRIFPLYFGFLLAVFFAFLIVGFPSNFPEVAPYLFTYTYNFLPLLEGYKIDFVFTHFWSLSVEEQFYIFWPFIIFFLNSSQLKLLVLFLFVASPVIRFGLYEYLMQTGNYELHDLGQIIYRFTPAQVDAFALGGAIPIFALTEKVNTSKILK
jgi:peptidoglycan/LPS O-acetylase OafA/YrhL